MTDEHQRRTDQPPPPPPSYLDGTGDHDGARLHDYTANAFTDDLDPADSAGLGLEHGGDHGHDPAPFGSDD